MEGQEYKVIFYSGEKIIKESEFKGPKQDVELFVKIAVDTIMSDTEYKDVKYKIAS